MALAKGTHIANDRIQLAALLSPNWVSLNPEIKELALIALVNGVPKAR